MLSEKLRAIRRVAVICIIVSLSITALIGIATLLGGDFGDVQGKIMMTTLVIGTFSVLALADLAVAGRRFEWSGYVGILAAVAIPAFMALRTPRPRSLRRPRTAGSSAPRFTQVTNGTQ